MEEREIDQLRAALEQETIERRRADCLAKIQTDVVKIAVDLLAREPDIDGFFRALLRTLADEGESHKVSVWLIDDDGQGCHLWMAHLNGEIITPTRAETATSPFPIDVLARHLYSYAPGWNKTVEYLVDDERMPAVIRDVIRRDGLSTTIVSPLILAEKTLGWITLCTLERPDACAEGQWWRVALTEAIARQAAMALHHSRVVDQMRVEERRKAILEERNRLARDIHDNLAQGFAAILMQLQAAQREAGPVPLPVSRNIENAVDLARTHLTEARRSVGTLRPTVGTIGDGVEREILGIAQEALANAVRHSQARRITIRASSINALGLRLSVADDGRGIPGDRSNAGFGLTSMQERADRIGASLTIVTAPRSGTEVVLAWEPSSLPTQVYAVG
jgi:signal transduction histidine kinase